MSRRRASSRPGFVHASWLFQRLLGVVYLVAIVSFWLQAEGLVGTEGILPAGEYLQAVRTQLGAEAGWRLPTLFWLGASDWALHGVCAAGALLSLAVVAGVAQGPALLALWAIYLSLASVGQVFLGYQWDNLLLETGLLAAFLHRWRLRPLPGRADAPSPVVHWLLRWLLFRLMLSSGIVKLASGDLAWRGLSALRFHYETQPLPAWPAWLVHQLPEWAHRLSAVAMFGVELLVPFLLWGPGRVRHAAAWILGGFQVFIAVTGNYGFFNLVTLLLCLLMLDDTAWPFRHWRLQGGSAARRWGSWLLLPAAGVIVLVSVVHLAGALRLQVPWPQPVATLYRTVAPWRSVNAYGLFAVMTTERLEIQVEGSRDGSAWKPYRFRWKPGDPYRRPRFVQPHMPRLDWQMWFAALGDVRRNPWFLRFLARLGEGRPEVLTLLRENPFPEGPPRYLRARLYVYRFTDFAQRRGSGAWWRRELRREYLPAVPVERLRRVL